MNEMTLFSNEKFGDIRTIEEDGKILFCGKDIASALGYSNPNKAINDHCRGITKRYLTDSLGREQETNFIPEGDLYRLAAKSELPGADEFERWIFDEVVPSIRKHGAYMTPAKLAEALLNPDAMIQVLSALKTEQDKNKRLQVVNSTLTVDKQIMQPKADYFDAIVDRNLLTSLRDTAKQFGVKEKDFIQFLTDKKYLYRDKKGKLVPYAEKNTGLFEVKECVNDKTGWAGIQTLITPRGRETFRLLMVA